MAKKAPDYDAMTLEELTAAAREHREAIRELRAGLTDDATTSERLANETEIAGHRAHLSVINPLRTEKSVVAELESSQMVRKMRGMSQREWDRLRQVVNTPEAISEGADVHTPGVTEE